MDPHNPIDSKCFATLKLGRAGAGRKGGEGRAEQGGGGHRAVRGGWRASFEKGWGGVGCGVVLCTYMSPKGHPGG